MQVRDFIYWLQGHFELNGSANLNRYKLQVIKEHLKLVARNKEEMCQDDAMFFARLFYAIDSWIGKLPLGATMPIHEAEILEQLVQDQLVKVTSNPDKSSEMSNAPLWGYEPLGDIYNNQRLC